MDKRCVVKNIFNNGVSPYTQEEYLDLSKKLEGYGTLLVDTRQVTKRLEQWLENMAPIIAYYAVKAFADARTSAMFEHFDCASFGEIDFVLKLGKDPKNIIFANPTKRPDDIRFAVENGVYTFTSDSVEECQKILAICPMSNIIIRLSVPDAGASIRFSNKFGVDNYGLGIEMINLLMPGNLYGFSFHVGSRQQNIEQYGNALYLVGKYQ